MGSKNFAARRQNCDARAKAQRVLSEYRHRVDEVLAIVKDEQEVPVADRTCDGFGGYISSAQRQPKHLSYGGRHETRIGQRGKFDKPAPIGKFADDKAGDLQGKGSLPNPARPGQGHDAIGGHEIS